MLIKVCVKLQNSAFAQFEYPGITYYSIFESGLAEAKERVHILILGYATSPLFST